MTAIEKVNNFNEDSKVVIFKHCETMEEWHNKMIKFYRDNAFDFQTYLKIIINIINLGEAMKSNPQDILDEIKRVLEVEDK